MKFYMEVGALMVLLTLWMTSMMVLQVGGDSGNLKNLEILKRQTCQGNRLNEKLYVSKLIKLILVN